MLLGSLALSANVAFADCAALPNFAQFKTALTAARTASNGGFNLDMWGTVVDRDGIVCHIVFTGLTRADQWPGSRVISAQKANTANAFSLPGLALSTANAFVKSFSSIPAAFATAARWYGVIALNSPIRLTTSSVSAIDSADFPSNASCLAFMKVIFFPSNALASNSSVMLLV